VSSREVRTGDGAEIKEKEKNDLGRGSVPALGKA